MERNVFEKPVWIYAGLNLPCEVSTVGKAYAFLNEWPVRQRGVAHRLAMKACLGALAGELHAETARSAFAAFARRFGILAPDVDDVVAARSVFVGANRTTA